MVDETGPRLRIPPLTGRSAIAWCVGTVVAVVGILGYLYVTQPQNRWAVWVVGLLLVVFVVFLVSRRCWIETATGTVVWQRFWVSRTRLTLKDATAVEFVTNRGGSLSLGVRADRLRAQRHLPILNLTTYVEKSQPPEVLRGLADQLEQWSAVDAYGQVPNELRAQAKHVSSGGEPKDSPLAPRVSHSLSWGPAAGGAAGGGSDASS